MANDKKQKQELWDKVIAAIKEYQEKVGTIEILDWNYDTTYICFDRLSSPGSIYTRDYEVP